MRAAARLAVAVAAVGVAAGLTYVALKLAVVREDPAYEEIMPTFPAPEALPAPVLPGFRFTHPRLPAPTAEDIALLREKNARFLERHRRAAAGGAGKAESVVLAAFVEPGSQDLTALHADLMGRAFGHRGNHVLPVAYAYDWLHGQWTEGQREALARRLIEGCQATIAVIRNERLSPYNVYLYNRPLQSLMACALATFGDLPEATPVMAFTADLWKNRVLPVWRQVMGRNGGWHEGGEYVGLGIGQAIWQLPAMWRSATGEDLFATEPGIRGLLDFLVYRTQPDGTHFRWGDGSGFAMDVPDQHALAVAYGHAAAYALGRPPAPLTPTSNPWGPLARAEVANPSAAASLPRAWHADGLGLLVARSDWTPQATYVTFKAGDNYWSHSHLDQGAFTIFRRGPLAIDSAAPHYGGRYGSDHHLNYSYQTIAHNMITVIDPADTEPLPTKSEPRPIANDGGQRRVGSGWGIDPGPLDLAEWTRKREAYHTGAIRRLHLEDDLVVAVAEVTPAYTNALSGRGTFSHRTRRVERLWRTFGYDPLDDVVVVFDRVRATEARFAKRWLLHSAARPELTAEGFRIEGPADRAGGGQSYLHATVLQPSRPRVQAIGGPGFEYFADGRNYDEDGRLREARQGGGAALPDRQPGGWRVELMPGIASAEDEFLVVLVVSDSPGAPPHVVRRVDSPEGTVCEVVGPRRTLRWTFPRGAEGVRLRVSAGEGATREVDLTAR